MRPPPNASTHPRRRCAADGQWDMQLVATPIPLTGASGGLVAPTAIK